MTVQLNETHNMRLLVYGQCLRGKQVSACSIGTNNCDWPNVIDQGHVNGGLQMDP